MASRRRTLGELRWPDAPEFGAVAAQWNDNAVPILLDYVWRAYDAFRVEMIGHVDWTLGEDEVERSITQYLDPLIRQQMSGDEPFYVQHAPREYESREEPPAQAPEYDLAFVLNSNRRIMWPLEAKVLRTEGSVADYINEIGTQFLTCRYAPFSREAAMLGYLLRGDPTKTLQSIATKTSYQLDPDPAFPSRPHRVSRHTRSVPTGKVYPRDFACHHMILLMTRQAA